MTTGQSDDSFDIGEFEKLLKSLEESKGRQQRQKSIEGRKDIFADAIGKVMMNF